MESSEICSKCMEGYTLKNNECLINIDNCIEMSDSTHCEKCNEHYYLNNE